MSFKNALSGLKFANSKRVYDTDPKEHAEHLFFESDRASVILSAAAIEDVLTLQLEKKLGSLNRDELKRLFTFDGPLGTFSNKIILAQGLEIIDRPLRKSVELIKAMRNNAAHCVDPVDLQKGPFRDAILNLAPSDVRSELSLLQGRGLRNYFELTCMDICKFLNSGAFRESPQERLGTVVSLLALR